MADVTRTHSYSAGKFMLELDGTAAGFLHTVEGGEPFAPVVNEPVGANGVVRKHVGATEFAPIRMSFGTGMSHLMYKWITEVLNRRGSAKNGAIVFCDYQFEEQSRLQFDNAVVTEVGFPALDASARDPASFTLTIQPQATRFSRASSGTSVPGFGPKTQRKWMASNFRLKIGGLETACTKVNKIDPVVVKQAVTRGAKGLIAGTLEISNLTLTLPERDAQDFSGWFDDFVLKGNNAQENERPGTLEFLDVNKKTPLFTVKMSNLGITRIRKERTENNAEVIARVGVEFYCEQIEFSSSEESVGVVVKKDGSVDGHQGDNLLDILRDIRGEKAPTKSNDTVESDVIARRLVATEQPVVVGPSVPQRDDGISIGKRWASDKATLEELRQVAALESGEWTAVRLDGEHSLIAQLSEAGVLPPGGDGPLDLERDAFVEGIVAGASQVLRSTAPHLSSMLQKTSDTAEGTTQNLK